jgi:hypothetical protein
VSTEQLVLFIGNTSAWKEANALRYRSEATFRKAIVALMSNRDLPVNIVTPAKRRSCREGGPRTKALNLRAREGEIQ